MPRKVYGFFNQKGGAGKTPHALHLAYILAEQEPEANVAVFDLDPQKRAQMWANARKEPPLFSVFGKASPRLNETFEKDARTFDYVILDGPANVSQINVTAMACTDVVVIPTKPLPGEIWCAEPILDLFDQVSVLRTHAKAVFLVNQAARTSLAKRTTELLEQARIPTLKTVSRARAAWDEAMTHGLTVFEVEPNGPAAAEARALYSELLEISS
jgi:chromosome partitioning protein